MNPFDALGALGATFAVLTIPTTWVRVGLFFVAIVFLIIGFAVAVSGEQQQ